MTATSSPTVPRADASWVTVCRFAALAPERGIAAIVGTRQAALFLLPVGDVHAVDNRDPFSGANVMARGITGTRGDRPTVTSPMYKQVFDLASGVCLDDPATTLAVFPVRLRDGWVELGPPTVPPPDRDDGPGHGHRRDDGPGDDPRGESRGPVDRGGGT